MEFRRQRTNQKYVIVENDQEDRKIELINMKGKTYIVKITGFLKLHFQYLITTSKLLLSAPNNILLKNNCFTENDPTIL